MKKSHKGALAAGAAAVLLLGGAGSLAYWNDSATVDGGSLTSGTLQLNDVSCQSTWAEADGPDTDVQLLVPGDTVTKQCTGSITMTGDNIAATVELDDESVAAAEAAFNEAAPNEVAGDAVDITAALAGGGQITESGPVTVTITVDWPFGTVADNESQGVSTSELNNLEITAVQVDPN